MPELGQFALRLGLFLSGYAVLMDLLGRWRDRDELCASARNATLGCLLCLTVALGVLTVLLVRSDFAVRYVAENTARSLPLVYKLTAVWAGAAGSLLLWLWLQTGFVAIAFAPCRADSGRFCAVARAAANFVAVFFFLVLIFDKDPFHVSLTTPRDGAGLNPLLQHPAMVLHPPTLFLGYAALAIPFAWTFAALATGGLSRAGGPGRATSDRQRAAIPPFFGRARNWSLFGWMFLTVGIGLGAWWAYEELGWGGYWAWDPVENSSLMPWLTGTALLHCARAWRVRGKTATWFMVLALVTFSLCIFGTFLTRYGLVSSVHAFPDPGLGILFLVVLVCIWLMAAVLFVARRVGSARHPAADALADGRSVRFILWNNWLMLLLTFVILVGTLFPFFSGLLSDRPISLKSEYFTKITAPGGLILLLLLGACPHLIQQGLGRSWRTWGAVITGIASVAIWALAGNLAMAYLVACAFVGLNLAADFVRRYTRRTAQDPARKAGESLEGEASRFNLPNVRSSSLRWYGARIVHVGVLLAFVGIAGSGGFDTEKQVALRPGERVQVGRFELTYNDLNANHGANFTAIKAQVSVSRDQQPIGKLSPALALYGQSGKRTSEVDVRRSLAGDLYLALTDVDTASRLINLTIFIKPLIDWIWIGSILMVLGTGLVLAASRRAGLPARQRERDASQAGPARAQWPGDTGAKRPRPVAGKPKTSLGGTTGG
jgi:cytochrome c-type biogenesis protein CcmF